MVARPSPVAAAFAGAALLVAVLLVAPMSSVRAAEGAPPPLPALAAIDGTPVSLAEAKQLTYVLVAARWCVPCEDDLHTLRRTAARLRGAGFRLVLVGVGTRQSKDEFVGWARAQGFDGTLVYDEGGRIAQAVGASVVPWHLVVAPGGRMVHNAESMPDAATLAGWQR